ncbi:hypothetical protein ACOME3_004409 [Neoechinorhynchus agilis]
MTISTFANGSAHGPDRLRQQHLKYMTSFSVGDAAQSLKMHWHAYFTNLQGEVISKAIELSFDASLCVLVKKEGVIRPIAIGTTLRRITAKILNKRIAEEVGMLLHPTQ